MSVGQASRLPEVCLERNKEGAAGQRRTGVFAGTVPALTSRALLARRSFASNLILNPMDLSGTPAGPDFRLQAGRLRYGWITALSALRGTQSLKTI